MDLAGSVQRICSVFGGKEENTHFCVNCGGCFSESTKFCCTEQETFGFFTNIILNSQCSSSAPPFYLKLLGL